MLETLLSRCRGWISPREMLVTALVLLVLLLVLATQGSAYTVRMLVEASCYAIVALGLTIQWGYGGQFNAGVMGFIALGGFCAMLFSVPVNEPFWASDLPGELAWLLVWTVAGIALVVAVSRLDRVGVPKKLRTLLTILLAVLVWLLLKIQFVPLAQAIESEFVFIGGLGLPAWLGWLAGGLLAGAVGYFIGRVCLGLRSDYLAIATLGIAEIIKAILKNEDWLTRGTATVSPLPWPTPGPAELGFVLARSLYLALTAVLLVVLFYLLQKAYYAPWGRMIRAIRDNEISAQAMGKNVNKRRLEVFVFGCILIGIGGGALTTFNGIFDAQGYLPLNHTLLVLVMVILGGPGNNLGTLLGALLVYIIWVMSEPLALSLMQLTVYLGDLMFGWEAPDNLSSRALQSRVFVIGLLITLVLRYAPRGLMPEKLHREQEDAKA